jgi:asparagine synthase (glutamine-hydrolysing)
MLRKLKGNISEAVCGALISPTARSLRRDRLTYLIGKKLLHMERELAHLAAAQVAGDVVEFGVALGGSAILLAKSMADRRFHGFDVFGMIPPPTSDKDDDKSRNRYEVIRSGRSEGLGGDTYYGYREDLLATVKRSFAAYGVTVDQDRVSLHQGLFEATWPVAAPRIDRIAFAHIDCDWYDPVTFCLNGIAHKMAHGGSIVLDDYNDYGGCRTATDEFLRLRGDFQVVGNFGNLVIRRALAG